MITIVLADDHTVVRDGLRMLLESEGDFSVVGEAATGTEALSKVGRLQPDIVLLDIRMPHMDGIETVCRLPEYSQQTRSLIISMYAHDEYVLRSARNGADGYLLKDATKEELMRAIRSVHRGHKYFSGSISQVLIDSFLKKDSATDAYHLTKREREILKRITDRQSNEEIAQALNNSVRTIETHRFRIMKKLGVNNWKMMVQLAQQEGLV
ncbi:response regulator [Tunicatimonas pelagia]|uniref:response regulator n=1 Tax=Tunicatimonas pelagia TaxID=931531 RepID=UPI002665EFB1|nr:response regulator transcription factor [Tunicatimonas pelagia]WKN40901.1 response regulator transcription factor [Tunicatimonas pelagia]